MTGYPYNIFLRSASEVIVSLPGGKLSTTAESDMGSGLMVLSFLLLILVSLPVVVGLKIYATFPHLFILLHPFVSCSDVSNG